jgi:hypothetical protein
MRTLRESSPLDSRLSSISDRKTLGRVKLNLMWREDVEVL